MSSQLDEGLLRILNEDNRTVSPGGLCTKAAVIRELVSKLNAVQAFIVERDGEAYGTVDAGGEGITIMPELKKAILEVNKSLEAFAAKPVVSYSGWILSDSSDFAMKEFSVDYSQPVDSDSNIVNQRAVQVVLALIAQRRLHFFRRCECGKWFVAPRKDSFSCCDEHRRFYYRQGDDYRAKKTEAMRVSRAKRKDRDRLTMERLRKEARSAKSK